MKITALEIRQKTFEKEFRGVNKAEVSAFLLSMSHAWEEMVRDHKELKHKLEQAEKEVQKLREIEDSLFKTLKTAETTGASMVEQANKSAELLMRETKLKAEQLYSDAQQKADNVLVLMQEEVRNLEQEYRNIENHKDSLIREVKALATDSLEKMNKIYNERKDLSYVREKAQNISNQLRNEPIMVVETPQLEVPATYVAPEEVQHVEILREIKESTTYIQFEDPNPEFEEENEVEQEVEVEKPSNEKTTSEIIQKSFFDEITD